MIEAIIFDLDGTLWDSTGCACDIWNRVLEKHDEISLKMTQTMTEQLMGKTMEQIGLSMQNMVLEPHRHRMQV